MAGNFESATNFFTSLKRLEKKTTTKRVQQQRQKTHQPELLHKHERRRTSVWFLREELSGICLRCNKSFSYPISLSLQRL